jgi:hypothetical protein
MFEKSIELQDKKVQENDVQKAIKLLQSQEFSNLKNILLDVELLCKSDYLNYLKFIQTILELNACLNQCPKADNSFYMPIDLNLLNNHHISLENLYVLKENLDYLKSLIENKYSDLNLEKQKQLFNFGFCCQLGVGVCVTAVALFGFIQALMALIAAHHLIFICIFTLIVCSAILAAGMVLTPGFYQKVQEEGKILDQNLHQIKDYRSDIQKQIVPSPMISI